MNAGSWSARVRGWFSFEGRTGRTWFAFAALIAIAVKYQLDRAIGRSFGVAWSPLDYVFFAAFAKSAATLTVSDGRLFAAMLALSIPFAWLGLAFVTRRLRDAGLPLWLTLLFFAPAVNLVFGAVLSLWPSHAVAAGNDATDERPFLRFMPAGSLGSAFVALVATSILGFATLLLGSQILAEYGWGLFVAAPFAQGALAALVYGAHRKRSVVECIAVAIGSVALAGLGFFLFAYEGAICILMALPIAVLFATIGALFGYALQKRPPRSGVTASALAVLVLAAPSIMGAALRDPADVPVFSVTSSVDVAAPPDVVWRRIIAFPKLAPPSELLFRAGIAYPEAAHIVGRGVGAVRYCRFSTGAFVEPVTRWDPPHVLAFRVAHSPEPMQEWTPFAHVHPPHLDGYMESLHGQFALEPLPGGGTRLTGTTWYRHHLWPATYWSWWSNAIVHRIHLRVLDHIAGLAEADVARGDAREKRVAAR